MVLAPRHLNRVSDVEKILSGEGLEYARRSAGEKPGEGSRPVLLLDTMGELLSAFACANAAFVGGSLRDFGGHNPMEPRRWESPFFSAPTWNRPALTSFFPAARLSSSMTNRSWPKALESILSDREMSRRMAEAGPRIIRKFRGILARTYQAMENRGLL